eukprot:11560296-Alexandrium_andersonii.AAC.1
MAQRHLGGSSAAQSRNAVCPVCLQSGQALGATCSVCGASVEQPAPSDEEVGLLSLPGMLAERLDLHLAQPLSGETMGTSRDDRSRGAGAAGTVVASAPAQGGMLEIEDMHEQLGN